MTVDKERLEQKLGEAIGLGMATQKAEVLSTPRRYSGVSLGISSLVRIIGASIGPAVAGMYMQSNQSLLTIGGLARFFLSIRVIQLDIPNCCDSVYSIYSISNTT